MSEGAWYPATIIPEAKGAKADPKAGVKGCRVHYEGAEDDSDDETLALDQIRKLN